MDSSAKATSEPRKGQTAASFAAPVAPASPTGEDPEVARPEEREDDTAEARAVVAGEPVIIEGDAEGEARKVDAAIKSVTPVARGFSGKPAAWWAAPGAPKNETRSNGATTKLVAEVPAAAPAAPQASPGVASPSAWDPKSFGGRR